MKKQITAVITTALILANLTACTNSSIEDRSGNQGSVNTNSENTPSNLRNENNPLENSSTTESKPTEKVTGIYGETEISDIPCGELDYEGKAVVMQERDALKQSLDSMVFETHTFGDYTVSLVGDNVRTDKANFPGSIYTQKLRVEVEKNGAKIEGDGYYNKTVIYESQYCTEYRLFADKIGSYLDVYDLENPVIAMRYFYDDESAREVTKAVEFATIQNDKVYSGFVGTSVKDTGVVINPNMDGNVTSTILALNASDGENCRVSIFATDEFDVVDDKTLTDNEAGIRYIFEFSNPPQMKLYTTEKLCDSLRKQNS